MNSQLLQSIGSITQFSKDEVVFMQNDTGENMYVVLQGTFGVYINSFTDFPCRVAGIGEGSFFGEMSVVDGWPRSATIISEEEGGALIVEKENFALLLEKDPEISSGILNSLKGRANSTIESVRKTGKQVDDLCLLLQTAEAGAAKRTHGLMKMLAFRIRQYNNMLGAQTAPPAPKLQSQNYGGITLLPEGYEPFDIEDLNDNSQRLGYKKVKCPYCLSTSDSYIPIFSNLKQKEATLDQRIIFHDFDILWYTNIVCPTCNYTDTYQEFINFRSGNRPKFDSNQFPNAEEFTGFQHTHRHTLDEVIASYYLAIKCSERTSTDPLRLAKAWIRLYWLYSDNGRQEYAQAAAEKAIHYYTEYAKVNDARLNTEDKMRVNAILGELLYATNKRDTALEYFKENTEIGRLLNNDLMSQSLRRYRQIRDE